MTYIFTVNNDNTTRISVDFTDESVDLQGNIIVKGGEADALAYLPFFESDLRRNFAERFPQPEPIDGGEM